MQELKEQGAVHADLGCKVPGCGMQGLVQGPSGYFRLLSDTFLCISCLPCSLSGPRGAGGGMGLTTLGPRGAVLATVCVCVLGGVWCLLSPADVFLNHGYQWNICTLPSLLLCPLILLLKGCWVFAAFLSMAFSCKQEREGHWLPSDPGF